MASIPGTLLNDLNRIPRDRPVALLMRHSERFPIVDPAEPYLAQLTPDGVRLAEELGGLLGDRFAHGKFMSAPVDRCRDTAAAIAHGAGWATEVRAEEVLSHPFIGPAFDQLSRGEVNGELAYQAHAVLDLLLDFGERPAGLDVSVTHDTILCVVAGCLLKAPVLGSFWPDYLEGVFAWRDGLRTCFLWRGDSYEFGVDFS